MRRTWPYSAGVAAPLRVRAAVPSPVTAMPRLAASAESRLRASAPASCTFAIVAVREARSALSASLTDACPNPEDLPMLTGAPPSTKVAAKSIPCSDPLRSTTGAAPAETVTVETATWLRLLTSDPSSATTSITRSPTVGSASALV